MTDTTKGPTPKGPDFIVIGAMKCATSTVCAYLEDHPEVFMVPRSEPRFFSEDARFAQGTDWYESLFDGRGPARVAGEGSNDYAAGAMYPQAAARMAAYRPGLKIVYMARDPLERIASAWVQNRADMGDEIPPTPDQAVARLPDRFVDQSLYWKNLSRYRAHFPDAQIFVGFLEDLMADRAAFFDRLTAFLGVSPHQAVKRGHMNPSQGKRIPSPAYTMVNRLGLGRLAKAVLPKALRASVKDRILSTAVDEVPRFSPATRAALLAEIGPDAAAFLAHAGKPADFWTLS